MNDDASSFAHTHARAADPDTSRRAAEDAFPAVKGHRNRIAAYLAHISPAGGTFEQIAAAIALKPSQVWKRLPELEVEGRAHPREDALLSSGSEGRVWYAGPAPEGTRRTVDAKSNVRRLRKALLMAACHCQGGHSETGGMIAEIFGIPFPVTMAGLEQAAIREGFEPIELWPWLYKMRSDRLKQAEKDIVDLEELLDGR